MAGFTYSLYGFLDWIALQGVPFTATDEYLYAWAALIGVYPKDAPPRPGVAQFTGTPGHRRADRSDADAPGRHALRLDRRRSG